MMISHGAKVREKTQFANRESCMYLIINHNNVRMPKALPGFNLVENRAYYSGKKSTQESRTSKVSIKALLLFE